MIHTIAHEIAHALGFSSTFFSNAAMVTSITGIRGKDYAAPVVNGTTVVAKTREHYNCSTAQFMELEDKDPTGQSGSHWKTRNAQDELMAPVMNIGYYTALTMAAFEDLGFYKAVYSKAENASWGRDAGCSFLDGKCVIDGTTKFPSMFCDKEERVFRCTPGRLGMGRCALKTYDVSLASYFQYFSTPTEGGLYDYYDYCPNVVMWDDFGSCTQDATVAGDNVSVFNVFSMSARCIDGNFTPKEKAGAAVTGYYGMCVSVMCDTQLGNYKIKVHGDKKYRPCSAGQKLTLASVSDSFEAGGYITCPSYGELCQSNPQADADYQASVDAAAAPRTAMIVLVMLVLAMIRA
ncbi:Leishmanolysin [Lotmaria passim]